MSVLSSGFLEAVRRNTGRLRILFVKDDKYLPDVYGGVEASTDGLCRLLRRRLHQVAVVGIAGSGTRYECNGYGVYVAPRLTDALMQALLRCPPDVVVLQEFALNSWNSVAGLLRDVPVLFYHHSVFTSLEEFFNDEGVRSRQHTAFLSSSDAVRTHLTSFGISSTVVPPLFGIERYKKGRRTGTNIVMVSLQVNKGADIALEIARRRPRYCFLFVQSWTHSIEETSAFIEEIRRLPNATLAASVYDMSEIFGSAQLLLMPSRYQEGWGRVATEAQLFGVPVLGSIGGQLAKTIGAGGIALDPNSNIDVWLKAFDHIVDEPEIFESLADAAVSHARRQLQQVPIAEREFVKSVYCVLKERTPFIRLLIKRDGRSRDPG